MFHVVGLRVTTRANLNIARKSFLLHANQKHHYPIEYLAMFTNKVKNIKYSEI